MGGRERSFRLMAATALGLHAFFHGVYIAAFLLRWLAPSLMDAC